MLEDMGFRYFACCSHVDPARIPPGAFILHNYPDEWSRCFIGRKLHTVDPVMRHAERSLVPFFWNAAGFLGQMIEPQKRIMAEAAEFGLKRGYTVPIHLPWSAGSLRASCSLVPDSTDIDPRHYSAAQLMAMYLYAAATRDQGSKFSDDNDKKLSQRERQCLELAAQGKSDWAIGQLLQISEHTAHRHIERAKRRLGVATRIQAVIYAIEARQISFGDVIRAIPDQPNGD
jgi:DNA-binding CsgD family transcriptional regulator